MSGRGPATRDEQIEAVVSPGEKEANDRAVFVGGRRLRTRRPAGRKQHLPGGMPASHGATCAAEETATALSGGSHGGEELRNLMYLIPCHLPPYLSKHFSDDLRPAFPALTFNIS